MLRSTEIVLALAALCCVVQAQNDYDLDVTNRCPQPSEDYPTPEAFYYSHPHSCTKFISCAFGLPYVLECPKHTVFNEEHYSCVHERGPLNTCKQPAKADICKGSTNALIPNPEACQRYFNCSDTSSREYSHLDTYENECDYPDLFDSVALKCVPWNEANCSPGSKIGQDPCDYVKNLCVAAHCQPCIYRVASCVGKPDGLNEHPKKLWSPFYANCESNRTVEMLMCDTLPQGSQHRMLFSPDKKQCVSLWEVTEEHHGYMPKCEAGQQGLYVTRESNQVYYECPGAKVSFCEPDHIFSADVKGCVRNDASGVTIQLLGRSTTLPAEEPTTQLPKEPTTPLSEEPTTHLPEEPTTQAITEAPVAQVTDVCTEGSPAIIPNPSSCQRYFNCLDRSPREYTHLKDFEVECEYPDLFDSVSLRCVPYHEATCVSGAKIGQDPCDYLENQCVVAHCIDCKYRLPTCVGRPDGLNTHPLRPWSSFYVRCENNRSMEFHECPRHPIGSYQMIFSPYLKHCVSVWEVAREHRGYAPVCKPGQKGYYVTPESEQVYYECPGAPVFYCEAGQIFSEDAQACVKSSPYR